MASTGSCLRELRERHGVSLEELAQTTRIGQRYLEALESDDRHALPRGPFAKGFIRAYCQALGESAEPALALFEPEVPVELPRAEPPALPRRPRRLAPVLVSLALVVALSGGLAAVTVALRSGRGDVAQRVATAPDQSAAHAVG